VNAVDNIKARTYVDGRCVWYEKPYLEAGTLGTKCNSQIIIPHVTQCYSDSRDPDEESIPMCTLRNFPNQIEHCIEWGRDHFSTLFTERATDLLTFLKNGEAFVKNLRTGSTTSGVKTKLQQIKDLIDIAKNGEFKNCVQVALDIFNDQFDYNIRDLVNLFPEDHIDSHGQQFWSGPKRCPSAVNF
jgi:ubiquitin-activating enzyme E1